MNSHLLTRWFSTLAFASLPFLAGCEEDAAANGTPNDASTNAPAKTGPALVATNSEPPVVITNAVAEVETKAPDKADPEAEKERALRLQAPPPALSAGTQEIVDLAQARVGEDVILTYIENSTNRYGLKAPEILYLHDLGLSAEMISSMVRRDESLRQEALGSTPAPETSEPAVTGTVAVQQQPPPAATSTVPGPAEPPAEGAEPAVAESVSAEPAQVTNNYFYNSLAPYGTWMDLPDYGWCWQPSVAVVNTSWRPYFHNGRWVWTDSGWYWRSYYSWGWAPFHYGRWHYANCGWVWVPDNYWGPAWVSWRYYDGYYGWAPLPPGCHWNSAIGFTYHGNRVGFSFGFGLSAFHYAFVPTHRFYSASPWHYCASPSVVNHFWGRTTIINNYVVGNNHTVINHGPGTDRIAAASRTEIRRVQLRDIEGAHGSAVRGERLSADGGSLAVYRPHLPPQASHPPSSITKRQQEVRRSAEVVTRSEAVRAAALDARTRPVESARVTPSTPSRPLANPRTSSPAAPAGSGRLANGRSEGSRSAPTVVGPSGTDNEERSVAPSPYTAPARRSENRAVPSRIPEASAQSPETSAPAPTPQFSTPSRRETPRVISPSAEIPSPAYTPQPNRVAPSRGEQRVYEPAPRQVAPIQRSAPPVEAPTFRSAPERPSSAPSYNPPAASRPTYSAPPVAAPRNEFRSAPSPAPSYSAPPAAAPSRPAQPPSGGGSRGGSRSQER